MGEKKVVDRKVAIALGLMCVVLAVGLVGVVAYYTAIINLEKSETWVSQQVVSQPARGYYSWIFLSELCWVYRCHCSFLDDEWHVCPRDMVLPRR
jgi:hypothetical protein